MLILTRRFGETLIIELPTGEKIRVAALGSKGNESGSASMRRPRYRSCERSCWSRGQRVRRARSGPTHRPADPGRGTASETPHRHNTRNEGKPDPARD